MEKLISWLYHKFVCKPPRMNDMTLEDYLNVQEQIYNYDILYDINTFEQYNTLFYNWKLGRKPMGKYSKKV
jgi:hypothetical protein